MFKMKNFSYIIYFFIIMKINMFIVRTIFFLSILIINCAYFRNYNNKNDIKFLKILI